jgi:methyl-accepting chemotaxis protein
MTQKLAFSKKLILSFLVMSCIVLAVGLAGYYGIHTLNSQLDKVTEISHVEERLLQTEIDHLKWTLSSSSFLYDDNIQSVGVELNPRQCAFGKWFYSDKRENAEQVVPGLANLFQRIEGPHQELHQSAKKLNTLIQNNQREQAKTYFNNVITGELEQIQGILEQAIQTTNQQLRTVEANARSTASWMNRFIWLAIGIGVLIAIAIGYFFSRRVKKQITRIIDSLTESSKQVTSASNQLSSSSQKLAEGSSEQASSLEETSSSLEEMSSQTKQNADNAGQADSAVQETAQQVSSGTESVQRMSQAVEDIKNATSETSRIIKTIDDIAFQTNLLALNAAVEAARAGEAGKGFAVVAEEVRNLAQRSSEAAQETSELIEKSQTSANHGAQVAEEVASNLERIKEGTEQVKTLIGEISAASKEQSQGIEQVNNAVSEMDKVVQQNASDAEESASAAEELDSQAAELDRIVSHLTAFVHGENGHAATEIPHSERREVASSQDRKSGQKRQGSNEGGQRKVAAGRAQQKQQNRRTEDVTGHADQQQAERMIPLDDNDSFKDF